MNSAAIPLLRLRRQNIVAPAFTEAHDLVRHLGAVQAQDFAAAKWAVGLRLKNATEGALDASFEAGRILRTHVLRPTWHFVAPEDLGWMLRLTAPRVHAASAFWYRKLELEARTFKRSEAVISRALRGGRHLTRPELAQLLQKAGIPADAGRMTLLMIHAELEGVVCSGALKGKQHTYALLDERAPLSKTLAKEEALTELTRRYFTGHGPATLKDYIWWSGLSAADARKGLEAVKAGLLCEMVGETAYWFAPPLPKPKKTGVTANLLPNFDEYTVGYADRSAIFNEAHSEGLGARKNVLFENALVINGLVRGTWKRSITKDKVKVAISLLDELSAPEAEAVMAAVNHYAKFLQRQLIS